jgi:protein SCO1/2
MDPNMDFVKFFGKNYDAKALAEGVSEEIRNANKQKEVILSQHA